MTNAGGARHAEAVIGMAAWKVIVVGALGGLGWSCGLRGFMSQVAEASTVSWSGTFLWILLPGTVTGVLLGLAESIRRTTATARGRLPGWSPFVFGAVVIPDLVTYGSTLQGGIGGGTLGVPAIGVIGAYAIAGRRPWWRVTCALAALSAVPIWALTATDIGGASLALDEPRGLWVALYYWTFLGLLMVACSLPLQIPSGSRARDEQGAD